MRTRRLGRVTGDTDIVPSLRLALCNRHQTDCFRHDPRRIVLTDAPFRTPLRFLAWNEGCYRLNSARLTAAFGRFKKSLRRRRRVAEPKKPRAAGRMRRPPTLSFG